MVRGVLDSSRLVATHARGATAELEEQSSGRPIEYIALGEGLAQPPPAAAGAALRAARGIPPDAIVFGVFGGLAVEKRVPQILRAFAAVRASVPRARLVLAGAPDPALDLDARARVLGIDAAVVTLGRLDAGAFDAWIAAVDVSLNLRWPSALETSGPWLRALSASRPTVMIDLPHLAHVPTLDPRSWTAHGLSRPGAEPAVAVALDIRDEDHSLRLAMHRLAVDADLRDTLGRHARAYWEAGHTVERMADDYERVMARAVTLPAPAPDRPPHMAPDAWAHAKSVAASFGPEVTTVVSGLSATHRP
jgi:glycosyltransferase involved in cell wall biosynthesis